MRPDRPIVAFDRSRLGTFLRLVEAAESDPKDAPARVRVTEAVDALDEDARAELVALYWWGLDGGSDLASLVAEARGFDLAGAARYLEARTDLGEALRSAFARLWVV